MEKGVKKTEERGHHATTLIPPFAFASVDETRTLEIGDYSLLLVEGPYRGQEFRLEQESIEIGREDWCDIVLSADAGVSRHHCTIRLLPDGVRVCDLESSNGVYLDGHRIFDALLCPNDCVRVGHTVMRLIIREGRKAIALHHADKSGSLVGLSPQMRSIFSMMAKLASKDLPLLLTGETGTGKSAVARALHQQSHRADKPFVIVNCGAIANTLIEASLFGYEKGAFTHALKRHHGYFEQAHGGTLFLDEIGEMPIELQSRLLDVLERRRLQRLGGEKEIAIDVRLIAATNRLLDEEIRAKRFREDLYYRLSVMEVCVPPLRERKEDIPMLVHSIIKRLFPTEKPVVMPGVMEALQAYLWPGNVRQLANVIERATALKERPHIALEDLFLPTFEVGENKPAQQAVQGSGMLSLHLPLPTPEYPLKSFLAMAEKAVLKEVLAQTNWNIQESKDILNISQAGLYNRINKYGLRRPK